MGHPRLAFQAPSCVWAYRPFLGHANRAMRRRCRCARGSSSWVRPKSSTTTHGGREAADKASAERRTALARNPYFDIGGNRYRLVVRFDYARRIGFVRFVGIHAEYDQIDASTVWEVAHGHEANQMRGRLRRGAGDSSLAAREILTARASGRPFWETVSYGEIEMSAAKVVGTVRPLLEEVRAGTRRAGARPARPSLAARSPAADRWLQRQPSWL